jgi:hypothetical protein
VVCAGEASWYRYNRAAQCCRALDISASASPSFYGGNGPRHLSADGDLWRSCPLSIQTKCFGHLNDELTTVRRHLRTSCCNTFPTELTNRSPHRTWMTREEIKSR